jgi:hypothetical protein
MTTAPISLAEHEALYAHSVGVRSTTSLRWVGGGQLVE